MTLVIGKDNPTTCQRGPGPGVQRGFPSDLWLECQMTGCSHSWSEGGSSKSEVLTVLAGNLDE